MIAILPVSHTLSLDAFWFDCLTLKQPEPFTSIDNKGERLMVRFTSEQAFKDYLNHIRIFDNAA